MEDNAMRALWIGVSIFIIVITISAISLYISAAKDMATIANKGLSPWDDIDYTNVMQYEGDIIIEITGMDLINFIRNNINNENIRMKLSDFDEGYFDLVSWKQESEGIGNVAEEKLLNINANAKLILEKNVQASGKIHIRVYGDVYSTMQGFVNVNYGDGDVNLDGNLTQEDYYILKDYLDNVLTERQEEQADLNKDGKIDWEDYNLLYAATSINSLVNIKAGGDINGDDIVNKQDVEEFKKYIISDASHERADITKDKILDNEDLQSLKSMIEQEVGTIEERNETKLTLSKIKLTNEVEFKVKLTANLVNATFGQGELTWETSDESVVSITETKDNYIKIQLNKVGTAIITAKFVKETKLGTKEYIATCEVEVKPKTIHVTEINVTGITSLGVEQTTQLTAEILPTNATNKNVVWSSSNPNVATVDSKGLVAGKLVGTTTITATNGVITGSATVFIKPVEVTLSDNNITVEKPINANITKSLTATLNYADGELTWTTSDSNIASISGSGNTRTITIKKAGEAIITVSITKGGITYKAECKIVATQMKETLYALVKNGTIKVRDYVKYNSYESSPASVNLGSNTVITSNKVNREENISWIIMSRNDSSETVNIVSASAATKTFGFKDAIEWRDFNPNTRDLSNICNSLFSSILGKARSINSSDNVVIYGITYLLEDYTLKEYPKCWANQASYYYTVYKVGFKPTQASYTFDSHTYCYDGSYDIMAKAKELDAYTNVNPTSATLRPVVELYKEVQTIGCEDASKTCGTKDNPWILVAQ